MLDPFLGEAYGRPLTLHFGQSVGVRRRGCRGEHAISLVDQPPQPLLVFTDFVQRPSRGAIIERHARGRHAVRVVIGVLPVRAVLTISPSGHGSPA